MEMKTKRYFAVWGACLGVLACAGPELSPTVAPEDSLASHTVPLGWASGAMGKLRNKARSASDPDLRMCLDFEGAPAGAGAAAQLFSCEGTNTDGDIKLLATTAPYYKLQARPADGSSLCLGFDGFASGQKGKLQSCSAQTIGEFEPFNPTSTDNAGYVQLRLRQNTALCLDVVGTPGKYNSLAQLYACGATHVDGHWRFVHRTAADACPKGARAYDPYVRKTVTLPSPARTPTEQVPLVAFDIQGHRGARSRRPENSMAAFQYALEQGATTLEMDVIESADGVLVVAHDDDIGTHCDPYQGLVGTLPPGHPRITAMNYATLFDAYDCGHTVQGNFPQQESVCGEKLPRVENVIEFAEAWMDEHSHTKGISEIRYNIELKDKRDASAWSTPAGALHKIAVAYGVQHRTTVQTFDASALTAAQAWSDWTTSRLSSSWIASSPAKVYSYETAVWTTTPSRVAEAHTARKRVLPWTPNTVADVRTLYGLGVEGVITDDPEAMASFARVCAPSDNLPRNVMGKLKSRSREGLCLDFSGRPGLAGAEGQSWWCHDTDTDGTLQLLEASPGKVKLRTASSNLYVRIDPGATVLSSEARLGTSTQGVLDEFTVVPAGVYFQLRSTSTDASCAGGRVCLGAGSGSDAGLDEPVGLRCCDTHDSLLWAFCPGL